jgi:hypothetical protein
MNEVDFRDDQKADYEKASWSEILFTGDALFVVLAILIVIWLSLQ